MVTTAELNMSSTVQKKKGETVEEEDERQLSLCSSTGKTMLMISSSL